MKRDKAQGWMWTMLCGVGLATSALATSGCQVSVSGQTLPSPYYISDDVQYFPPSSEYKLSREAAAMQEYNAQLQADQR